MLIKCVSNHYVFQLFIRRQQNSRNVFKDMMFLCTCHHLSHFSADFGGPYLNLYQSNFGDSQSFFGLDASFCQDM